MYVCMYVCCEWIVSAEGCVLQLFVEGTREEVVRQRLFVVVE